MFSTTPTSKDLVISKIQEVLPAKYNFVRLEEPYVNSRGKVVISCDMHGEWTAAIRHITTKASGCPACGRVSTRTKKSQLISTVLLKINNKCEDHDYKFEGFFTEYKNRKSKITITCPQHGPYVVNINNFVDNNRKCPGCKTTGFNPEKIGYLYALRSACGSYIKVGISNKPDTRFYQLKKATPFDFEIVEVIKMEKGINALLMERTFHKSFESANFKGFDGCTEWLKWRPEIQGWFRFL
ncbi:hypothetical protein AAM22_gp37 [Pantoea phage vB_PagM_AAM22]|nr:hypothetical protein AAM22_gp37 [Pantoea phage vB_PagM_AAM22]